MKKLLIAAAALAVVAGSVQAQSVTVYGVIDQGYGEKDYKSNSNSATNNGEVTGTNAQGSLSSQRLGFRGTEDLGGGLRSSFVIETGITSGSAPTLAREFKVGLASNSFGSVDLGLSKTVSQLMMERYSAGGANNWIGDSWNYADTQNFGAGASNVNQSVVADFTSARATGVHYNSPVMSGFAVGVTYAEATSNDNDGTVSANTKSVIQDIAVVYTGIQNLSIGVSQGRETSRAAAATLDTKDKVTQFGASYVFGPVTAFGQYAKSETTSTAGAQSRALDGTQFGLKYAVSPTITLHAQMASIDEESTTGTKTTERKGQQFGAQYAFSKRTTGYVLTGSQEAKLLSSGVTNEVKGTTLGVRHSF
jgi:predicted porin